MRSSHNRNSWFWAMTIFALLTISSVVPYFSSLSGDFVWLDRTEIVDGGYRVTNGHEAQMIWGQTLGQYLDRNEGSYQGKGGYWRPVYALSLTLDWMIWKDQSWYYHLENIAWHFLCVLCLYRLGMLLLGSTTTLPRASRQQIALSAACLFAVHPMGVHNVTWISGRKDSLCAFFCLASILLLWPSRRVFRHQDLARDRRIRRQQYLCTLAGLITFYLAVGSKELALVVPPVVIALVICVPKSDKQAIRLDIFRIVMLVVSSVIMVVFRWLYLGGVGLHADYPASSWQMNVATMARVWWHYVTRTILPLHPTISDSWLVSTQWGPSETAAVITLVVFVLIASWGLFTRKPWGMAATWFLLWMLPASGIVPLRHLKAERYLYPASWGLLLMGTYLLFQWMAKVRVPGFMVLIAIAVICTALGSYTATQNTVWQNDQRLFENMVADDPTFAEGHLALASFALTDQDYPRAIKEATLAIEIGEDDRLVSYGSPFLAHTYRGLAHYHLGELVCATEDLQRALMIRPNHAVAYYHVGLLLNATGDLQGSAQYYRKAYQLNPDDRLCRGNLAHTMLALNNPAACVELLEPVVQLRPLDPLEMSSYGTALLLTKRSSQAVRAFSQLNELWPGNSITLAKLAWAEHQNGDAVNASLHIEQAQQIEPRQATVRYVRRLIEQSQR